MFNGKQIQNLSNDVSDDNAKATKQKAKRSKTVMYVLYFGTFPALPSSLNNRGENIKF